MLPRDYPYHWHRLYLESGHAPTRRPPLDDHRYEDALVAIANLGPDVGRLQRLVSAGLLRLADAYLAAAEGKPEPDRQEARRAAEAAVLAALEYADDDPDTEAHAWTLQALIRAERPTELGIGLKELDRVTDEYPDYWPAWIALGRLRERRARQDSEAGREGAGDLRCAWAAYWRAAELDGWLDHRTRAGVHLWRLADTWPDLFGAEWRAFKALNQAASEAQAQEEEDD